ncbi:unnamed protein product [Tilletia laevis]|uniref:Uncharacterized protein n=3 Tax=Tilletia TaxID=13289 RepID=A0A8X7MM49_9BASI|nr:hypothetical protein A4X06_0g7889 [Tilletia controversa]CAD6901680.1 unnamed protein product [Tilletia caries]CAD6946693.1 unnamed protein product [Tilletia laevis]CAD6973077.1 unnamed protein product [Tilletia controversa]
MNGQLGKTSTNRHRNGEIESSYTTAFCNRARFEMFLAQNPMNLLSDRVPPIKFTIPLRLDAHSILSKTGFVEVEVSPGQSYDVPLDLYVALVNHIKLSNPDAVPTRSEGGTKVIRRLEKHASLKYGHMSFLSTGSRATPMSHGRWRLSMHRPDHLTLKTCSRSSPSFRIAFLLRLASRQDSTL